MTIKSTLAVVALLGASLIGLSAPATADSGASAGVHAVSAAGGSYEASESPVAVQASHTLIDHGGSVGFPHATIGGATGSPHYELHLNKDSGGIVASMPGVHPVKVSGGVLE